MSTKAKDTPSYWLKRLTRRGKNPFWVARISHGGEQKRIVLNSSNLTEASKRAAEFWKALQRGEGWDGAMKSIGRVAPTRSGAITVGQWLESYLGNIAMLGVRRKTATLYAFSLRNLASTVCDIDSKTMPRKAWREKVKQVKLSDLSARAIDLAIGKRLRGLSDAAAKKALANYHIKLRNARNLFSIRAIELSQLPLSECPFGDYMIISKKPKRFRSQVDIKSILVKAAELPSSQRLIVTLAACCGLRRSEIDTLTWSQVDLRSDQPLVRIALTGYFTPKSESSSRSIPLAESVRDLFQEARQRHPESIFVIESAEDSVNASSAHYQLRAADEFGQVYQWLRDQGIDSRQPLHSLRKEFGSMVNQRGGIVAAMEMLGHSNISTTAGIYVEHRKTVTVGLDN